MKDGVLRMILTRVKVNMDSTQQQVYSHCASFCRSIREISGGSSICGEWSQGSTIWGPNRGDRALLCSRLARCLWG
ncbi:unnamed protein product [Arabidopsis halleri]